MEIIPKDIDLDGLLQFVEERLRKRKGFKKNGMPTLEIKNLPISLIDTSKNIRSFDESEDSIFDLRTSLDVSGQNYPILAYIYENELICAAGHRRIAAAKGLKWDAVWALVIQVPESRDNDDKYLEAVKQLAFEDNHSSEEMDFYDVCKNLYLDACRRKLLNRSRGVDTHTKGVIEQLRESQYRKYSLRQLQRMVKIGSWPKVAIELVKSSKKIKKKAIHSLTDNKIVTEKNVHSMLLVLNGDKDLSTISNDEEHDFLLGLMPRKREGASKRDGKPTSDDDINEERIKLARELWEQNYSDTGIKDFNEFKKILRMSTFIE